jgi:hypothetical protein
MIIDIDNLSSVESFMSKITSDWFDIDRMYYDLKSDLQINCTEFWSYTDSMINIISNYLECPSEEFLILWEKKCTVQRAMFMGYHCTRHSDKEVFLKKGILPLSEKTIKPSLNQKRPEAEEMWNIRSKKSPGPCFFMSYKSAKNPDNHFFKGPEILSGVDGYQPTSNSEKSIPLIIHCAFPFLIIPDKKFCTFCILRAYFEYLDPEEGTDDFSEGWTIDLKGNALDPQNIVRIEEI